MKSSVLFYCNTGQMSQFSEQSVKSEPTFVHYQKNSCHWSKTPNEEINLESISYLFIICCVFSQVYKLCRVNKHLKCCCGSVNGSCFTWAQPLSESRGQCAASAFCYLCFFSSQWSSFSLIKTTIISPLSWMLFWTRLSRIIDRTHDGEDVIITLR